MIGKFGDHDVASNPAVGMPLSMTCAGTGAWISVSQSSHTRLRLRRDTRRHLWRRSRKRCAYRGIATASQVRGARLAYARKPLASGALGEQLAKGVYRQFWRLLAAGQRRLVDADGQGYAG